MVTPLSRPSSQRSFASLCRFDTKDFYIPHTRTRGYLVAFRNPPKPEGSKAPKPMADAPAKWVDMVKSMQRPASSPFEAFLLPQNDPRLHQGRLELAALKGLGKTRMPSEWYPKSTSSKTRSYPPPPLHPLQRTGDDVRLVTKSADSRKASVRSDHGLTGVMVPSATCRRGTGTTGQTRRQSEFKIL